MAVGAHAVSAPAGAQTAGARAHAVSAQKAARPSSSETACRNGEIYPGGIPSAASQCISLIVESNGAYCLSSSGSPDGSVTSQKCNPNDPDQLWMARPNGLGPAYYQLWNVGSSCPSGASYYACGTPTGRSNIKRDRKKYGYGYCMRSPTVTPTTEFDVIMGPCFSLENTHGRAGFRRRASDFLPGGAPKGSYLLYEGVSVHGQAWVVSTSGGVQVPGVSVGIVRATNQNAVNELFYGAVLDASGATDGDPPPGLSG